MFIRKLGQLKKLFRKLFRLVPYHEAALLSLLRDEYRKILESDRYNEKRALTRSGFKVYSQADEDGIIEEIFERIGVTNRVFVEFGCGNGLENNSHYLLLKKWHGLWIEGRKKYVDFIQSKFAIAIQSGQLTIKHAFLTTENINDIISQHITGEIDLLSVDMDGNDFHIVKTINCIRPRVIVVEYNARKGPRLDWVMAYNPDHVWDGTDYLGASLKAFEILLQERGFSLVGCSVTGVNAFFVKNDLISEELFLPPFTSENHYEPHRWLLRFGVQTSFPSNFGPWSTAEESLAFPKKMFGARTHQ